MKNKKVKEQKDASLEAQEDGRELPEDFELISVAGKCLFRDKTIIVGETGNKRIEVPLKNLSKKSVEEHLKETNAIIGAVSQWKKERGD